MTTTFETAKVGDKVWSTTRGWGEIIEINYSSEYPLYVKYDSVGYGMFTFGGYSLKTFVMQTLFWDKIKFEVPTKPLPVLKVDAKVLVWDAPEEKHKRHFSHFDEYGYIYTFTDGKTSFTSRSTEVSEWLDWDFAE